MLACVTFIALFTLGHGAIAGNDLFSFGSQYGDTVRNVTGQFESAALLDFYDSSFIPTSLPSFKIFGADIGRNAYINYNGHITFGGRFGSFDPFKVNDTGANIRAIFNVYYSDNDLRRSPGLLYHRVSTNAVDLTKADALIRGRGFTTFSSRYCIIATWDNLKYYISQALQRGNPATQQENTYQEILCTDGASGHVIYQYNKIEWKRSQDVSTNYATVGWVVKDATDASLRYWVAPFSGTELVNSMTTGSNVGTAGRWMRSQALVGPCIGLANGVYAVNCTHYHFCCNEIVDRVSFCPPQTSYHPTLKYCVDNRVYNCGGSNFCAGRLDGHYANTVTIRADDFYRCKGGLTRPLTCPQASMFQSSARCT